MELGRDLQISVLLELYGALLTERQREAIEMHYNLDYSLSEIAENQGVSRQAALDSIKRGEAQLRKMENKLALYQKFLALMQALDEIELICQKDDSKHKKALLDAAARARRVWEEE